MNITWSVLDLVRAEREMRQGLTKRIYIHAPPSSLDLGHTERYFPGGKTTGA